MLKERWGRKISRTFGHRHVLRNINSRRDFAWKWS